LRIALQRHVPEEAHLQVQWNALIEQMESSEVFYTHEWALAMQRAYGSVLVPFVVLAYEGERLVGVASLATDRGQQIASFLAGTTADYCDFLSHPSQRGVFAEAVFEELRKAGIRKVQFANLPGDSATAAAISNAASRSGYHAFFRPAYLCARVLLGKGEDRAGLKSTHLRKNMFRRNLNRLNREGVVALTHARSWKDVAPLLSEFAAAHVARFLATGRNSNLRSACRRLFLEELGRSLSASGWLTLTRLMIGDHAIAWNYGFQFGGSWFWYQPTFDSKFEALSPGHCLLTHIVAEACDQNDMQVVDLGLGAEGYKERFANGTRATVHGTLNRSRLRHLLTIARYRASCLVQGSPQVESVARRAIGYGQAIHRRYLGAGIIDLVTWGFRRCRQLIYNRDEVAFYVWTGESSPVSTNPTLRLVPLTLEILASAAMQFEDDTETYDYLLRSARRLREGKHRGFALLNPENAAVHFCSVGAFEEFFMQELQINLEAPSSKAVMIFDCWTPTAMRGQGYYGLAASLLARESVSTGNEPWIFSAVTNQASVRGLERSGFEKRYSLVRTKILMRKSVKKKTAIPGHRPAEVAVGS
jgi:CelD/BcsL family acetyltransferase involved in cellulose biosynthesis